MRDTVFFLSLILSIEKQQCAIFLSTEQDDIHSYYTYTIGRGPILFDISFANRSEIDSNI